jgi:hypothetical protein
MMDATFSSFPPTAMQVVVVGELFGAHETAWTLASGVKLAVVSQPGVEADVAVIAAGSKTTPTRVSVSTVASAETASPLTASRETTSSAQVLLSKRLSDRIFSLRRCLRDGISSEERSPSMWSWRR